ncbi:MAG: rod shape-determining protein MreD [Thermodesulfobacteriota bacterium]
MTTSFFFLLGTFLIIIRTALFPAMPEWLGRPDLYLILIVFISLHLNIYSSTIIILLLGLILDIVSGIYSGLYPITLLLLMAGIKFLSRKLIIKNKAPQIPIVLLSYLFINVLLHMTAIIMNSGDPLPWSWRPILFQMLVLAVLTMPCFTIFDFIYKWLSSEKKIFTASGKNRNNRFKIQR